MIISVARALTELKTLNSRIEDKINRSVFVAGVKSSSKKVNDVYTRDEFDKEVKSNYDSVRALIKRKKDIKTEVVKSNAITLVTIGSKQMTVADAIERKSSIELDKLLLRRMEDQYRAVLAQVSRSNEMVEQNLNNLLAQSVTSDKKEDMTAFSEAYRNSNAYEVVNPLKLQDEIEKLKADISEFETECDAVLSESNAITKIEIPD